MRHRGPVTTAVALLLAGGGALAQMYPAKPVRLIAPPHHLALEMLKGMAQLDLVHVAYKGSAPMRGELARWTRVIKAGKIAPE